MADLTDVGTPPLEQLNRVWRPLSPVLLFGWKTATWILGMLYGITFLYTLWVVIRATYGIPIIFVGIGFAAAPWQADQQIFIDYVSIVAQCAGDLWNQIFRIIANQLVKCVKIVCCLYNYLVHLLRYNAKLFLDYFRGLLIENMPELLETVFGIPAEDVQEIMDYLDLTLPPGFPCNASGGGTTEYLQCVLDELEQGQPSPDILDCRGFKKYKQTMSRFYGVPYDTLIHAHKRDGGLTLDGVLDSYIEMRQNTSDIENEDMNVDDNEWNVYRVRSYMKNDDEFVSPRSETSLDDRLRNDVRVVRSRLEYAMAYQTKYTEVPRNISGLFPGIETVDEYIIAVMEASCTFFNEYFDIFWDIFLGVFFTIYDIAWEFLQFVLDFGFTGFQEFFIFLLEYLFNDILNIPCLEFSPPNNFAVSIVNCPCELFASELGYTYYPAVGNDSDTYLAALFSCSGFDCAVDGSGVATLERFYSNCIVENFIDLLCDDDGDCPSGFTCQNKIFFQSISIDFLGTDFNVTFQGWCLPSTKRNVMVKIYVEKIKMERQYGATAFGAADNSSVEYWDNMMTTAPDRYARKGLPTPVTLEELVEHEFDDEMDREALTWLRKHSPNRDYWRRLKSKSAHILLNEESSFDGKTTFKEYPSTTVFMNKVDITPWKRFSNIVGRRYFDRLHADAGKIGAHVHNVDWDTYNMDGTLKTSNGVPVGLDGKVYPYGMKDDDTIDSPINLGDTNENLADMANGEYDGEAISKGYTRLQLMIRAFSDVIQDNVNALSLISWDPVEYKFKTPSPTDLKYMFARMRTKDNYGAAIRHLTEAAREQKRDMMEKGWEEPAIFTQFATTIKLLVTRFVAPTMLGDVSRELRAKSPAYAASVKRILPDLTEGHEVDKLVEEIYLGNTTIWDFHRYTKILRRNEIEEVVNHSHKWALDMRNMYYTTNHATMYEYMRDSSVDKRLVSTVRDPTLIQMTVSERIPGVGAIFSLVLPLLKNPKLLATGVAPFLTSRYGMTITYNILRTLARPLEKMYSEGLVPTLGNPTLLQEFAEDFGLTILNNAIFLIEEGMRLLLCNWWAIVINAVSSVIGAFLWYVPYIGQVSSIALGFINALGSGVSLTFGYCPPKPVLVDFMPVDLPWNYLFNLLDCDPEAMCSVAGDCISNAPCRCRETAQYESFFWELNGDRDGPPCVDGGGMPTGYCLCWPSLPCDFVFPEVDLNKPFSGDCVEDFEYISDSVATWQEPGFKQWTKAMVINWYKSSQFITRAISQGRKRYLSNNLGFLLMTISLGIGAIGLRNRYWVALLLIWLIIMFVWDMWNDLLEQYIVPKTDSLTTTVIIGPIMKFFLTWVRFPNYTDTMPIGDLRDGEFTCFVFNSPSLFTITGIGMSLAGIIYALWVAGIFYFIAQYIMYLLCIIPTMYYHAAEGQQQFDAENALLEEDISIDDTGNLLVGDHQHEE